MFPMIQLLPTTDGIPTFFMWSCHYGEVVQLLDPTTNANPFKTIRVLPSLPDPKACVTYPTTGASVLLPINMNINATYPNAEVAIFGGVAKKRINKLTDGYADDMGPEFKITHKAAYRINLGNPNSQWQTETMPDAAVMRDATLMPNGKVCMLGLVHMCLAVSDVCQQCTISAGMPLLSMPQCTVLCMLIYSCISSAEHSRYVPTFTPHGNLALGRMH
jgi:hypothetical protein